MNNLEILESFLVDEQGQPIKLNSVQKLAADFIDAAPTGMKGALVIAPMGVGLSTLAIGWTALKLGPPPSQPRLIVTYDGPTKTRVAALTNILNSSAYRKSFPSPCTSFRSMAFHQNAPGTRWTMFDSLSSLANSTPDQVDADWDRLLRYWLPRSIRAVLLGRPITDDDLISRLERSPFIVTLRVAVNRRINGYTVEMSNVAEDLARQLESVHAAGPADIAPSARITAAFEIPLARPQDWYLRQQNNDPMHFDHHYRCKPLLKELL